MRIVVLTFAIGFVLLLTACQPEERQLGDQEMQVAWGAAIYRFECARCHDPNRPAVVLQAERLVSYRDAPTLFEYTRQAMPLDKPGALPDTDYWDVTAFMLAANGMLHLPANVTLGPETAGQVNFLP